MKTRQIVLAAVAVATTAWSASAADPRFDGASPDFESFLKRVEREHSHLSFGDDGRKKGAFFVHLNGEKTSVKVWENELARNTPTGRKSVVMVGHYVVWGNQHQIPRGVLLERAIAIIDQLNHGRVSPAPNGDVALFSSFWLKNESVQTLIDELDYASAILPNLRQQLLAPIPGRSTVDAGPDSAAPAVALSVPTRSKTPTRTRRSRAKLVLPRR